MSRFAVGIVAFAAFALVNPLFFFGCGPDCPEASVIDFSAEKARQQVEPYTGESHTYSADNEYGTLTFTIRIDEARIPEEWASLSPIMPAFECLNSSNLIRTAAACSYERTWLVDVSGVVSATFEPESGDTQVLLEDRSFDAQYRTTTENRVYDSEMTYRQTDGLSFNLFDPDGEDNNFELKHFDLPSYPNARIPG